MAPLDRFDSASTIPDNDIISRSPEESPNKLMLSYIGPDRLPNFEDHWFLFYINAIVKETLHWHLVAPLGEKFYHRIHTIFTHFEAIPHMATNNDEYDGYYIPKGTIVLGNSWSV